jgi:hypothetical protein
LERYLALRDGAQKIEQVLSVNPSVISATSVLSGVALDVDFLRVFVTPPKKQNL